MIARPVWPAVWACPGRTSHRITANVPDPSSSGHSFASRGAITDVIRAATFGSYGVTGPSAGALARLLGRLGIGSPGVRVSVEPTLDVELDLVVGYGLPVAEVARQVDSAVRYAVRRAVDRDVASLAIHVDGLRLDAGSEPPERPTAHLAGVATATPARRRRPSGATIVSGPGRDAA